MTTATTTEKLYWSADPSQASFEAHGPVKIVEHRAAEGETAKPAIVLAKTIFYPEGGGQLGDVGSFAIRIADAALNLVIVDTQIDDAGEIHHILEAPLADEARALLSSSAGAEAVVIKGSIDLKRRRDHTAQHTAQHSLSRALADAARAETVSARLGRASCTIDVSRPGIADADLHRAEDLVNDLIAANVEVRALYPAADEIAKLPLRKQPKVTEGVIRIIDIDGFDMTPCGGTHCSRTGQIGQVRIVGLEKYKGMLRITFHAGLRALTDARTKHDALTQVATDLTCGVHDVPSAVTKLRANLKETRTQLDVARAELADLVARATLANLPPSEAAPIVVPILRETDDVGALRVLAGKLASDARVVALAAAIDPTNGDLVLVIQRGANGKVDCGAFMQAQTKARGGRGGGRPERAEGRFPRGTSLDDLASAVKAL